MRGAYLTNLPSINNTIERNPFSCRIMINSRNHDMKNDHSLLRSWIQGIRLLSYNLCFLICITSKLQNEYNVVFIVYQTLENIAN